MRRCGVAHNRTTARTKLRNAVQHLARRRLDGDSRTGRTENRDEHANLPVPRRNGSNHRVVLVVTRARVGLMSIAVPLGLLVLVISGCIRPVAETRGIEPMAVVVKR